MHMTNKKSVTIEEVDNGYAVRMYTPGTEGPGSEKVMVHNSIGSAMKSMKEMMGGEKKETGNGRHKGM